MTFLEALLPHRTTNECLMDSDTAFQSSMIAFILLYPLHLVLIINPTSLGTVGLDLIHIRCLAEKHKKK